MRTFLAILCFVISNSMSCRVEWFISELPIVFGQDVKLVCYISDTTNCDMNSSIRIWSRGTKQQILSMNGKSTNESKYTTDEGKNSEFSLIIKHFSQEDVNHKYSCSHGFNRNFKILAINDSFESPPTNQTIEHYYNLGISILNVHVRLTQIHPVPNCSIFFQQKDLSLNLLTNVTKENLLYNVEFNSSYEVENALCGHLQVFCTIGSSTYAIIDEKIYHDDQSNEKEICMQTSLNTETPQNIIDILLFGLFGIFLAVAFMIVIYRQSFGKFYMYILTISLKNENRNANLEIEKKNFLRTEKC